MKPLTANLKHLYQIRFMWIFHLILAVGITSLFLKMTVLAASEFPVFFALLFFTIYGQMIGATVLGTSGKPFTFCLPDHARNVKKKLFTIWSLIATVSLFILSILYLFGIHIGPSLFISYMGLATLCFWLGTSICIRKLQLFLSFFILLTIFLMSSELMNSAILRIFSDHPWTIAFSSGILSYLIYHASGSRTNHRQLCDLTISTFRPATKAKPIRFNPAWLYRNKNGSFSKASESLSTFFTGHIAARRSGLMPYLWGQMHLIVTPIFSLWKFLWLSFLSPYIFLIILPCFIARAGEPESYLLNAVMLVFFSLAFSMFCDHQGFRSFLLRGRTVHFFQGFVTSLTAVFLALLFLGLSLAMFNYLTAIFPKIVLLGSSFTMVWIPWILLIIPFILIPLFGGLLVLFRGIVRMLVLSVTTFFTIIFSFFAFPPMETASFLMIFLSVLSAAAVTWGFHLAVLYSASMKRSLC